MNSYKQKNQWLLLGTVLLLLVAYWFSFRKTIQAYRQNKTLTQQSEQIQSASFTIQQLEQQLAKTKINNTDGSGFNQTILFEKVSHFCESNQLNILTFDEPKIVQTDDYEVTTNYMEIEGGFKSITELTYELEQKLRLGRMASVHYELDFDRKTKQDFLIGRIYLQNIQNKD
jgi:uncharacterized protein involved in propanediol utilization